jgi:hypothetical protein
MSKEVVRDGQRKVIGFVDDSGNETVVRDSANRVTGRTSDRFGTTRDEHGRLVSSNNADPGLLIKKEKK